MAASDDHYVTLGVKTSATIDDIKHAFRNLAKLHHPDKGGNPEHFKKISGAYEVLSDTSQRAIYDSSRGGVRPPAPPPPHFAFSFGFPPGARRMPPPGWARAVTPQPPIRVPVTLEEIYSGTVKNVNVTYEARCTDCDGSGGKPGTSRILCSMCNGQGSKITVMQLGPGVLQQMYSLCSACVGQKSVIAPENVCDRCAGSGIAKTSEDITVTIPPGASETLPLELPLHLKGKVEVYIHQLSHSVFVRRGNHVLAEHHMPLVQALTGGLITLPFLNGKTLHLKTSEVCKPGDYLRVTRLGFGGDGAERGDLFLHIHVDFPDKMTDMAKNVVRTCLPGAAATTPNAAPLTSVEIVSQAAANAALSSS
jgi:DnaJ homolog subfamily A member 2